MTYMKTILLFLLTTGMAWGQADSLRRQLERGEITGEEWYLGTLKLGQVSDDANGWVKYDDQVDVNSKLYKSLKKKSGLIFFTFQQSIKSSRPMEIDTSKRTSST
jgi:hypothetical protein